MPITSPHNEALKEIRKLAGRRWRDKLGEFVAEGEDLVEAADADGVTKAVVEAFAEAGFTAPRVFPAVPSAGARRIG